VIDGQDIARTGLFVIVGATLSQGAMLGVIVGVRREDYLRLAMDAYDSARKNLDATTTALSSATQPTGVA